MDKPKSSTLFNSYLRSKLAESVKVLTGIQDLSDSFLYKVADYPDRLIVIVLTISRQLPACYPKCDRYCCFLLRASQFSTDCHSTVQCCAFFSYWWHQMKHKKVSWCIGSEKCDKIVTNLQIALSIVRICWILARTESVLSNKTKKLVLKVGVQYVCYCERGST
jgi:hypothetical protein